MKKGIIGIICLLAVLCVAAAALAFGPNPSDSNKFKLQTIQPSATTCTTIVAGRATTVTATVSQAPYVSWKAFDSAGAGVVVKRSLNGGTGIMPSTGETALAIGPSVKTLAFSRYSGSTSINLCYEK